MPCFYGYRAVQSSVGRMEIDVMSSSKGDIKSPRKRFTGILILQEEDGGASCQVQAITYS